MSDDPIGVLIGWACGLALLGAFLWWFVENL